MTTRPWQAAAWLLALSLGLGGCSGNYKFSDDQFRPLGEPQAINRGR
ncbi:type VI secretion protein [Pseudomonas fulva]|nr:type VI secretion protein [Pseudomonas fulva]MBF8781406.1 type VI secretion protein [Pseudomonas fulva]